MAVNRIVVLIAAAAVLVSCNTYHADGRLQVGNVAYLTYEYAVLSPDTEVVVRASAIRYLKGKGYIIFRPELYDAVRTSRKQEGVLVVTCRGAGKTSRAISWSQAVECTARDLATGDPVYHGFGDYRGSDVEDDYRGATKTALDKLPPVGANGRVATIVELQ